MKKCCKPGKFIVTFVIIGFSLAAALLIASAVLRLTAGRIGNYYLMNELSIELIHTSRKCVGVTALGAFLMRIICF